MHHPIQSSLCALTLSIVLSTAAAQTPNETVQEKPLARIETIEAKIAIRAFDPLGKRVRDLKPQDVVVIENGAGRPVTNLKLEPANVLIVLDHSLEMGAYKTGRERSPDPDLPSPPDPRTSEGPNRWLSAPVSVEFTEQLIAALKPADRTAIIQYSDKAELVANWTANGAEARAALRARFRQGRGSRLFDALRLAADTLQRMPEGRRTLVLLTDGVDTASQSSREEAWAAILRAGATVYVLNWSEAVRGEIGRGNSRVTSGRNRSPQEPAGARPDTASARVSVNISPWVFKRNKEHKEYKKKAETGAIQLERLAEESGGDSYSLKQLEELTGKSASLWPRKLLEEIGAEYTLSYLTERRANETTARELEVIGARPGLSIRARTQYFVGKSGNQLR
jgi:VWFA-related protein